MGLADGEYTENNRFNEGYQAVARQRPGVPFASANTFTGVLSDRVKSSAPAMARMPKTRPGACFCCRSPTSSPATRKPMLVLLGAGGRMLVTARARKPPPD